MRYCAPAGAWRKCSSASDKTKEKAGLTMKSFSDLQYKPAGSSAISSEKAGRKFGPIVGLLDRARPPSHRPFNRHGKPSKPHQ